MQKSWDGPLKGRELTAVDFFCLTLLVLAAAALRFPGLNDHSLWWDEWLCFRDSESFKAVFQSTHAPGFHLFLKAWRFFFGDSTGAARALPAVFGTLSPILVFLLGRRFFNARVAWFATALYVVSPMAIWYSRELRMYSCWNFFCLLSLLFLIRYLEGGRSRRDQVGFWMASSLSVALHYYGVFFQFALFLGAFFFLCQTGRDQNQEQPLRVLAKLFLPFATTVTLILILKIAAIDPNNPMGQRMEELAYYVKRGGVGSALNLWLSAPFDLLYFTFPLHPPFQLLGNGHWLVIPLLLAIVLYARDATIPVSRRIFFVITFLVPLFFINGIAPFIGYGSRHSFPLLAIELMLAVYVVIRATRPAARFATGLSVVTLTVLAVSWFPLIRNALTLEAFPLKAACELVSKKMSPGDFVVLSSPDFEPMLKRECGSFPAKALDTYAPENSLRADLARLEHYPAVWLILCDALKTDPQQKILTHLRHQGYHQDFFKWYNPHLAILSMTQAKKTEKVSPRKMSENSRDDDAG